MSLPRQPGLWPPAPGYQQPWYPPPGPPKKGDGVNWTVWGVVALVTVAAVVIVVVLHSDFSGNPKGSTTSAAGAGHPLGSGGDPLDKLQGALGNSAASGSSHE